MKLLIVLCLIIIAVLAALLVYCQRRREDDISRMWDLRSENLTLEKQIEALEHSNMGNAQAISWYTNQLLEVTEEKDRLTDKLAGILCPHESHLWDDTEHGKRCRRCGKEKNVNG